MQDSTECISISSMLMNIMNNEVLFRNSNYFIRLFMNGTFCETGKDDDFLLSHNLSRIVF